MAGEGAGNVSTNTPNSEHDASKGGGRPDLRRRGFPKAAATPLSLFTEDAPLKAHADYRLAKSGDPAAASRLVRDIVSDEVMAAASQAFGSDAIYAPVVAEERAGHNAIPVAFATLLATGAGATVTTDLLQINRAFHTGAGPMERLSFRPRFVGPVEPAGRYVIVDDTSVMGSTLAELADCIQKSGGEVIGAVLLVNASRSGSLVPENRRPREIEARFGDAVREIFEIDPAALTADEAAYILNFRDADALRNRAASAIRDRDARLRAKGLLGDEQVGIVDNPGSAGAAQEPPEPDAILAPALEAPTPAHNPEMQLPEDFGPGRTGKLLFWIAVAFATFQIVTAFSIPLNRGLVFGVTLLHLAGAGLVLWAAWIVAAASRGGAIVDRLIAFLPMLGSFLILAGFAGGMPSQVLRTVHVGFLSLLGAGMLAQHGAATLRSRVIWWAVGGLAFLAGLYHWEFYIDLVRRSGSLTGADIVVGVVAVVALFVLVWRVLGPAVPIVAGVFLAYTLLGQHLPSPLNHRGYDFEQVVNHMAFGTEGIYGTPTAVSATYIFLFILFGSFMEQAGVIRFFNEIAIGVFGGARGGPGKVCVASSALMGTVSGSGVANVVASGQFTIPLMKRFGFPSAFAGGVEATSSMGGQIMPPVMGAVAFIMAETIGVPYADIVIAAIIPAMLYFAACFWSVHLEAGKRGLHGLPRDELPSVRSELRRNWFLILPLVALVYLLFAGFTPLFAGAVGLALTVVLIVGGAVALGLAHPALRIVYWVGLALLCGWSIWTNVVIVLAVVAMLVGVALFSANGRSVLAGSRAALADGARQALPVGLACALVGVVIGTMTLTGLGTIIGTSLIGIGRDSIFLALVLTMIFSLILGMGIPTIPNYIITSSLAAPILLKLGVPLIVSHMFVFYFGIMADLTPPVALAAFAAAPMAKVSGMKIGVQAVRIALPGFIIPYMAVYDPSLMLQPVEGLQGSGYWLAVVYVVVKATLAMLLWGAAAIGYVMVKLTWWERVLATTAAAFLVLAVPATDEIGFALSLLAVAIHVWRSRSTSPKHRAA